MRVNVYMLAASWAKDSAMDIDSLPTALAHARAFAATLKPGDVIDDQTGFSADNLLALIAAAAPPTAEDAVIEQLGDLA